MRQTFEDEYMDRMRRRYAKARTRADKTKLIDEAIKMCNLSRKFVIRLLNGSYRYHPHCGRAPTYSQESRRTLVRIWLAMGQMCPLYLHAVMDSAIRDYAEAKASIPEAIADELRRMSVSTITRIIRPHRLVTNKANKRSGAKQLSQPRFPQGQAGLMRPANPVCSKSTPSPSAEGICVRASFGSCTSPMPPPSGLPAPPPGIAAPRPPAKPSTTSSPTFPSRLKSSTSTTATSSSTTTSSPTSPPTFPMLTRSRPYRKNDNNRIEQKNGSVIRALFGDLRFSDHSQLPALTQLCDEWSLLNNHAIPCTCQLSKIRRTDVKGLAYRRIIDTPRTPWQRLNALLPQPPPPHLNAILLRRRCEKTLRRLFLTQHP